MFSHCCLNILLSLQDTNQQNTIYFEFQKIKYWFDEDENEFLPVAFPVDFQINFYQTAKGFQDEIELKDAEKKYGINKYVLKLGKVVKMKNVYLYNSTNWGLLNHL